MTLSELEVQFRLANSVSALDQAFQTYLKSCKITGYTCSLSTLGKTDKILARHEFVSESMKSWHAYYHEEHYGKKDQTQVLANKSSIPIFWDVREQLKAARTQKDRKMRQESLDFGVIAGLTLPVHGPDQDFLEVVLRQFTTETCLFHWREHQYEWQSAAVYYYHYLKIALLKETAHAHPLLTPREQQCFQLLSQHYSPSEIATTLGMTIRTVQFHTQNINHKLGVKNKYQAIALDKAVPVKKDR